MQILDPDGDELADPGPGQEQRLDHQAVWAAIAVGLIDESLDLGPVEALHGARAHRRHMQTEPPPDLLDDELGLVLAGVVLAPEPGGLADHFSEIGPGWRFGSLTAPFPRFPPLRSTHGACLGTGIGAVSRFCAPAILSWRDRETEGARTAFDLAPLPRSLQSSAADSLLSRIIQPHARASLPRATDPPSPH